MPQQHGYSLQAKKEMAEIDKQEASVSVQQLLMHGDVLQRHFVNLFSFQTTDPHTSVDEKERFLILQGITTVRKRHTQQHGVVEVCF